MGDSVREKVLYGEAIGIFCDTGVCVSSSGSWGQFLLLKEHLRDMFWGWVIPVLLMLLLEGMLFYHLVEEQISDSSG